MYLSNTYYLSYKGLLFDIRDSMLESDNFVSRSRNYCLILHILSHSYIQSVCSTVVMDTGRKVLEKQRNSHFHHNWKRQMPLMNVEFSGPCMTCIQSGYSLQYKTKYLEFSDVHFPERATPARERLNNNNA